MPCSKSFCYWKLRSLGLRNLAAYSAWRSCNNSRMAAAMAGVTSLISLWTSNRSGSNLWSPGTWRPAGGAGGTAPGWQRRWRAPAPASRHTPALPASPAPATLSGGRSASRLRTFKQVGLRKALKVLGFGAALLPCELLRLPHALRRSIGISPATFF